MPVRVQEGRRKEVVEIHLRSSAVPVLSIVELHTRTQREGKGQTYACSNATYLTA